MPYTQPGPTGILYFTSYSEYPSPHILYSECSYKSVIVNTTFRCEGVKANASCEAYVSTEMPELQPTALPLGYWFPQFLQSTARDYEPSQLEDFIQNPYYAAHIDNGAGLITTLDNVTAADLSERLGLAVNAYWSLGLEPEAFTGPDEESWNTLIDKKTSFAMATKPQYSQYKVFWPWLILQIVCSVLLTIASIAAAIWESRVIGPDFLGFVNTAVKKSVKMPKSMSAMNARDRLHALRECEVLLQDMKPDAPVGKVALGVKEETSARLVPGRQYR